MSPTYEHRCIGSNVSQATNLNLIVNKSRLTRGRHSRTPTTNVGVSTAKNKVKNYSINFHDIFSFEPNIV